MPFCRTSAIVCLLALSPGAALAQDASSAPRRHEITVAGVGEASASPDLAVATFTVERSAKSARGALDQANKTMSDVLVGMKDFGIEPRDLQTSGFAINPQYSYDNNDDGRQDPPKLVGYQVQNSLSVRIRDLAKTGDILDRAVTLGVNSGGSISFDIEHPASLRRDARQEAVRDATDTARALADAAGVRLGGVITLDSVEEGFPPPLLMARMAMEAAPAPAPRSKVPVEAGETTIHATVRMTFAIDDGAAPK